MLPGNLCRMVPAGDIPDSSAKTTELPSSMLRVGSDICTMPRIYRMIATDGSHNGRINEYSLLGPERWSQSIVATARNVTYSTYSPPCVEGRPSSSMAIAQNFSNAYFLNCVASKLPLAISGRRIALSISAARPSARQSIMNP